MDQQIIRKYKTIIGNPPYVKTRGKNLYIYFIEKCFELLSDRGEVIFIVPSSFFGLTSSSKLLNKMMNMGTFTHIYHPNNERLFDGASIDIVIFRYCKDSSLNDETVNYNDEKMFLMNNDGLITFCKDYASSTFSFGDCFNIHVGLVSGREEVYKHEELGNIEVLNDENKMNRYICIDNFPSDNKEINDYLLEHKEELINRRIRNFDDGNWFEWGALRNINVMKNHIGEQCIYVRNLTRNNVVAFLGVVGYFGGKLIILIPKINCNLSNIVKFINGEEFRKKFTFSGRFKIGQRHLTVSRIPTTVL